MQTRPNCRWAGLLTSLVLAIGLGGMPPRAHAEGDIDLTLRQGQTLVRCEEWIRTNQYRRAFPQLMELHTTAVPAIKPRVDAALARIAMLEKRTDKAWEFIAAYASPRPTYDPNLADAHLMAGDVLIDRDQKRQAVALFDWIARNDKSINLVCAAEGCGKAFLALDDCTQAIKSFTFALRYAKQTFYDKTDTVQALIHRLEGELKAASRKQRALQQKKERDLYGPDFVIYRDAERLRRGKKDFEAALDLYREVQSDYPKGPYADAAGLYEGLCLLQLGENRAAQDKLKAFYLSDRTGLYRGEALLELARLALERDLDVKLAAKYFQLLDDWLETARRQKLDPGLPQVKASARPFVKPPASAKTRDFWGNVTAVKIEPGQLVNHRTCCWYLDDLEGHAMKLKGFVCFCQGDKDAAMKAYDRLLAVDPESKRAEAALEWNDYRRLRWGLEHGHLYAHPQELALYKDRQRAAVLLGDMYYCTQQFEQAVNVYQRLLNGDYGALTLPQRQYPHFAIGSSLYRYKLNEKDYAGASRAAIDEFEQVLAQKRGTWTELRAARAYCNLGLTSRDPAVRTKAETYLQAMAEAPADNRFTQAARIDWANRLLEAGQTQRGITLLQQFKPEDGDLYRLAQYVLQQQNSQNNKERNSR